MTHIGSGDDDLPPGDPLCSLFRQPATSNRQSVPPRPWRLRRIAALLLVLLLIVTGSLQELVGEEARSLAQDRAARNPNGIAFPTVSRQGAIVDANGNRRTQTTGGQITDYDELNRLIATSGAFEPQSGYDANGNRTSVAYGPGGVNGIDTFEYDWNNRLTAAEVDGVAVEYGYAGDDLRTERTQGGSTAPYLWDRLTAPPTMVGDGASQFVHGPGGVQNEVNGSAALRPLQDGLGSVRVWTNASDSAVGAADYDAWGMGQASTGTTGVFGWTGEQRDPTTSLVYFRARDYSAGTGRFAQRDTVQPNAAGTNGYNPYAYANNVPTTLTDPTGHSAGEFLSRAEVQIFTYGMAASAGAILYTFSTVTMTNAGAGAVLLALGASPAFWFALLGLLIFVVLYLHFLNSWCYEQGCVVPMLGEGRVHGWVETIAHAGGFALTRGFVGVRTGACLAALAFPSLFFGSLLARDCGRGDDDPTEDDCSDEILEALGDWVLEGLTPPEENVFDDMLAGTIDGGSDGPNRGSLNKLNDRYFERTYGIKAETFKAGLVGNRGSEYDIFEDKSNGSLWLRNKRQTHFIETNFGDGDKVDQSRRGRRWGRT